VVFAGRIIFVPTRYPKEFRDDVIAVARKGDQSIAKVSRSFGISESCLARWLRIAGREDGLVPETRPPPLVVIWRWRTVSCASSRNASSRRTRSCAARPPTSPAMCSQNDVPAGP